MISDYFVDAWIEERQIETDNFGDLIVYRGTNFLN